MTQTLQEEMKLKEGGTPPLVKGPVPGASWHPNLWAVLTSHQDHMLEKTSTIPGVGAYVSKPTTVHVALN